MAGIQFPRSVFSPSLECEVSHSPLFTDAASSMEQCRSVLEHTRSQRIPVPGATVHDHSLTLLTTGSRALCMHSFCRNCGNLIRAADSSAPWATQQAQPSKSETHFLVQNLLSSSTCTNSFRASGQCEGDCHHPAHGFPIDLTTTKHTNSV